MPVTEIMTSQVLDQISHYST